MGARPTTTAMDYFPSGIPNVAYFEGLEPDRIVKACPFDFMSTITSRVATVLSGQVRMASKNLVAVFDGPPIGEVASRLSSLTERLNVLLNLREGWNSYGALPISWEAIDLAVRIVFPVVASGASMPDIVPTSKGGVQLEWHRLGRELEIEATPDQTLHVYFEDLVAGDSFEGDLAFGSPQVARFLELTTGNER